jgi:cathepsin L
MDQAFAYVIDNGITTEDKYPYKAADGKCQTEGGDFKIAKCIDIPASDCDQLKAGIAQQPISIAVDAQPW